jgi:hypothetical protein
MPGPIERVRGWDVPDRNNMDEQQRRAFDEALGRLGIPPHPPNALDQLNVRVDFGGAEVQQERVGPRGEVPPIPEWARDFQEFAPGDDPDDDGYYDEPNEEPPNDHDDELMDAKLFLGKKKVDLYTDFLKKPRKLQPYCPEYSNVQEVLFRLQNSVILYEGTPMHVKNVLAHGKDQQTVLYGDLDGKDVLVPYSQTLDLRSPDPGYVTYGGSVYFLARSPVRSSKQGMNGENTVCERLATAYRDNLNTSTIRKVLSNREDIEWEPKLFELFNREVLTEIRLSNQVAITTTNSPRPTVYYKNRKLGPVQGHKVLVDIYDAEASWIHDTLDKVKMKAVSSDL